ncbi:MAG: HAD-IA family hydrolase [Rhodobacteraceae bacterium]|nr:HAD-IA family hydrolase [Paracoccaceae bacterium]
MKTAVFDLDGTIVDTSRDLIDGANLALCRVGIGEMLDADRDRLTAFQGGRAMLRLGFTRAGMSERVNERIDTEYQHFLADYESVISRHSFLYPGAEAALADLAGEGWRLAVCTNKPERLARILLQDLDFLDRFDALIGADTLTVRKPEPEPLWHAIACAGGHREQAFFVGDSEMDALTARAAGIPSVLVSFGPEGDAVKRYSPDALLPHFDELPGIAARIC